MSEEQNNVIEFSAEDNAVVIEDLGKTSSELTQEYDPKGLGTSYPVEAFAIPAWRKATADGETLDGYWDWVEQCLSAMPISAVHFVDLGWISNKPFLGYQLDSSWHSGTADDAFVARCKELGYDKIKISYNAPETEYLGRLAETVAFANDVVCVELPLTPGAAHVAVIQDDEELDEHRLGVDVTVLSGGEYWVVQVKLFFFPEGGEANITLASGDGLVAED